MPDIRCAVCKEPFDSYCRQDGTFTRAEWKQFVLGQGCPACGFGTLCVACDGTGKQARPPHLRVAVDGCPTCADRRRIQVWRQYVAVAPDNPIGWRIGYGPFTKHVPAAQVHVLQYLGQSERKDGWIEEAWIQCPDCWESTPPCEVCGGTGQRQGAAEYMDEHFYDLLESLD